jgi:Tfp pilus assembly protein PilN
MRAPVKLLETVVHSVPHGLWLMEIKQTGMNVQMDGRAMSNNQVADFAQQMQDSGYFNKPVEISTTSELVEEVPVIRFVMKAEVAASAPGAARSASPVVTAPAPAPAATTTAPPASTGPVVATVTPRGGGR